jgi:5-methylcytosine-specific restriction endonuclease McrA
MTYQQLARRAMKKMSQQQLSWRSVLLRDVCVYCFKKPAVSDHIHPRSKGGSDGWENRSPCCRECDKRKNRRSLLRHIIKEWGGAE